VSIGPTDTVRPGFGRRVVELTGTCSQPNGPGLVIGFSFGGWLCLAAALELLRLGRELPNFLCLSPVLGKRSVSADAAVFEPRARKVRAALGLEAGRESRALLLERLSFIFAADDPECDSEEIRILGAKGRVSIVPAPAGHYLSSRPAHAVITAELDRLGTLICNP
jgi:hypothetical protein